MLLVHGGLRGRIRRGGVYKVLKKNGYAVRESASVKFRSAMMGTPGHHDPLNSTLDRLKLCLAVDEAARGQGLGKELFRFVLQLAIRLAKDYGCTGVLLDAKPEAVAFILALYVALERVRTAVS